MFIKPKISQQQAENILSSKKSDFSLIRKLFSLKSFVSLDRLEVVYLPFYLFDVLVEKGIKNKKEGCSPKQTVTLTVDGLLGHVVLYAEDALEVEKDPKKPAPSCDFELFPSDASKIALEQYKGILLEHGLRTRSFPRAKEISEGKKIFYPFWIGYIKKRKGYDFKALDAVSGEIQGIKMRRLFIQAFRKFYRSSGSLS
ncbi:MAG: hypothetical protein PVF22_05585 [Candidatus Aminicenantes bacterium]|jgi:hypothetical protein